MQCTVIVSGCSRSTIYNVLSLSVDREGQLYTVIVRIKQVNCIVMYWPITGPTVLM